jgi:pyruvate dehydrogenase E2 component (dihydrolipoamide acetyltransferase)
VSQKDNNVPVQQVTVPDIGGAEGAEVIELLVAVGDTVAVDQGLIVLESDKASMEIPSTAAGTVVELLVKVGDQLSEGAAIAKIEVAGEAAVVDDAATAPVETATADAVASTPAEEAAEKQPDVPATPGPASAVAEEPTEAEAPPEPSAQVKGEVAAEPSPPSPELPEPSKSPAASPDDSSALDPGDSSGEAAQIYAGPAVRKLAREFGVPLSRIEGTGPQGRILKEDLQQFVQGTFNEASAKEKGVREKGVREKGVSVNTREAFTLTPFSLPGVPDIDFAAFGEVEVTQRSRIDKLTAANMHRSWLNVPHVTQFDEADITDMEAFRAGLKDEAKLRDTRLTPLPFILKACAVALREHPRLNASLTRGGEDLVYKKYIHIGMAVDTPAGLVVPVIRDVDRKSIWELAQETAALAAKARDRKLAPGDMQGGCFTVSSLGSIGGNGFTPIVNTPEVGILGVSKAAIKPVWDGSAFAPRTLLPLALSYDHRVVNGGDGGRFLTYLVELLGDLRRLSL